MTSKRHHYVPQFYLRYFLPSGSATFWVYDKDGGPARAQTPANTAAEGRLYSIDTPGGGSDDSLERLFARVESVAKPILDRWQCAGARPELPEVEEIAQFLGLMHCRVPRTIEQVKELGIACSLSALDDLRKNPGQLLKIVESWEGPREPPSVEGLQATLQAFLDAPEEHSRLELNRKYALEMSLLSARAVVEQLLSMNWCLCDAPSDAFFLTGDSPVNIFVKGGGADFGTGLESPHIEVAFPISPTICLLLDRRHNQRRRRVGRHLVDRINRRTVGMAERFVISPLKTKQIARWVMELSYTRGIPKLDPAAVMERYGPKR